MRALRTHHGRRIEDARSSLGARWAGLLSIWAHMALAGVTVGVVLSEPPSADHITILRWVGEIPSEPLPVATVDPPDDEDEDWERFVRIEKPQPGVVQETDRIAAHSTSARVETRTPVTSDREGPLTRPVRGSLEANTSRGLDGGGGRGEGGGTAAGQGNRARGGDRLAGGAVAQSGGEAGRDSNLSSSTAGDGVAVVETIGRTADRRGTAMPVAEVAIPDPAVVDTGPSHGPALGSADPVEELRRALGWGGIDRDRFAPRPEWAGTLAGAGATHTSPQTALDEVAISWETAINARGTPVGIYISAVEDIVGARWQRQDIGTHSRAAGIQGQVTVQYKIRPTGKVTDLVLARSSGNAVLDRMALDAIPRKLPRFPPDVDRQAIGHRMVLRYRNPLIATSVFLP